VAAALMLAGCNSDDGFVSNGNTGGGGDGDENPVIVASSLTLLASSPQMGSGGNTPVELSAIVQDASNNLMAEVPVTFSASSGALQTVQAVTDSGGRAIALLTPGGDPSNRTINVSALAAGLNSTMAIAVTGTNISVTGESSATIGDTVVLTVTLRDSDGDPLSGRTVAVGSAQGNGLAAPSLTTNFSGQVTLTVTTSVAGADTITVSADGATATHGIAVSGDEFAMIAPDADAVIDINTCSAVTVGWSQNGVAMSGQSIAFSTTRGILYSDAGCLTAATSANTDGSGEATLYVRSNNAGPATLTVASTGGPSTSRSVNFVATQAVSMNLQASPSTIGPNNGAQAVQQQSTITATVRDGDNNLVANKAIRFSIVQDNSGGTLTSATAITNLQGRASTSYVSSSATTAKDGVIIRAEVEENTAVNATVNMTVAQSALFVRLGTGNEIEEPNPTTYRMPYTVIVTDSNGNAAAGVPLNISINPSDPNGSNPAYAKGQWVATGGTPPWGRVEDGLCVNEDLDMNGILDALEDTNGDSQLTPGNVASVPTSVVTEADGTFEFGIVYPQQYATWVHVRLTASASVDGTEALAYQDFWLPILADDISDANVAPPGETSPFGTGPCP
jgi:hypothetical protein